MYPDTKELINDKNRRSLLVSVSASAESGKGGVIAEGYGGIPLRKGEKYDLSFYMKGASMASKTVSLTGRFYWKNGPKRSFSGSPSL